MLLTQFDPNQNAILNPGTSLSDSINRLNQDRRPGATFPSTVIGIFSHVLFTRIAQAFNATVIAELPDIDGDWPVYEFEYNGMYLGLCKGRLGAPACVSMYEEVIALGAQRIILVGSCGALTDDLGDCHIIVPTQALRDEGTSFHYAPTSRTIDVNTKHRSVLTGVLDRLGEPYHLGMTWTTDGFYRETRDKVNLRKADGACCVEMECAAMQALCNFRGVEFFQYLYVGDSLAGDTWDPGSLGCSVDLDKKEQIIVPALELAFELRDEAVGPERLLESVQ